jgi:hypothetical protein
MTNPCVEFKYTWCVDEHNAQLLSQHSGWTQNHGVCRARLTGSGTFGQTRKAVLAGREANGGNPMA